MKLVIYLRQYAYICCCLYSIITKDSWLEYYNDSVQWYLFTLHYISLFKMILQQTIVNIGQTLDRMQHQWMFTTRDIKMIKCFICCLVHYSKYYYYCGVTVENFNCFIFTVNIYHQRTIFCCFTEIWFTLLGLSCNFSSPEYRWWTSFIKLFLFINTSLYICI